MSASVSRQPRGPPRALKPDGLGWWRAGLAPVLVAAGTVALAAAGSDLVADARAGGNRLPWLGSFLLAYSAFLHGSRVATIGWYYLCEVLWGCNTALVMAGVGMLTARPLLIGTAICIVGLDQLAWYLDCLSYLATGKFHIGVAKYLVAPTTSRVHFATAFHHLFFLPMCFFALRGVGMPPQSYVFSVVLTSMLAVAARLTTPYAVDEGTHIKVFNINMSFAFWDDVQVPLVHRFDYYHPAIYLPYLIVVCNLYLNTLPVLVLYVMGNSLK